MQQTVENINGPPFGPSPLTKSVDKRLWFCPPKKENDYGFVTFQTEPSGVGRVGDGVDKSGTF